MALDQLAATALDHAKGFGGVPAHVADERRLDFRGTPLQAGQKAVQTGHKVGLGRGSDFCELRLDRIEIRDEHGFEQGSLRCKVRVERLLAHAQFPSKILHRNAAKSMGEEVLARGADDSLANVPGGTGHTAVGCVPSLGHLFSRGCGNVERLQPLAPSIAIAWFFLVRSQSMSEWMLRPMLTRL